MSLFGNNPQQSNSNTSNAFGSGFGANNSNTNNTATTSTNGSSVASNTITNNSVVGNTINSNSTLSNPLNSSLGSNSTSKLLKDLLESAHNLPKSNNLELGNIHLTLNELQRKSQLLRKHGDSNDVNYTKAHYLLASSGINAEEIENELSSISLPPPTDNSKSTENAQISNVAGGSSNNLDNYLLLKKNENILSTIEQSLNLASKDFDNFINSNISIDWKVRRDELRKSIGLRTNNTNQYSPEVLKESITWNQSVPGAYSMLTPLNSSGVNSDSIATKSSLKQLSREKFENHAKIIYQLNEARLEKSNFLYGLNLVELTKYQNDLKSKQISEAWKILIDLTNEKFSKSNGEHKYFEQYQSGNSVSLNKKIINNSKAYLEAEFYNYMEEIYVKDAKKPAEFSSPTNLNKISYFINTIIIKNNTDLLNQTLSVNNTPIWALLFYLIRAGLYQDALDFTLENKSLFSKFDSNFPVYLKKFVENDFSLPSALNQKLHSEFNQQFQFFINDTQSTDGKFDPYKYSVYKILGKCDLSKKSLPQSINLSIEDWLWFHLSILTEDQQLSSESALVFENYNLVNLQNKIISLGPKNFNTSSNNPLYLRTLIMVGLYELAVQYTYEQINECDSVHLAIGLNYYGLLHVSNLSNKDELLIIQNHEYQINFSRLLGSYTRTFKISDPKVACQYLILIGMTNSKEELSKCHEALRELILISREFSMLLGELNQNNGVKTPGVLERQRLLIGLDSLDSYHHQIIEISAMKCEEEGRIFDALLLYQLCQEYDTVLSLINKLLAEILSSTELDKPIIKYGNYEVLSTGGYDETSYDTPDNNIILLAQQLMKIFKNNSLILQKLSSRKKETCDLLLQIVDIRNSFIQKDWNSVITGVSRLGLIPLDPNDDLLQIRKLSELIQTNNLDDTLIKVIPSLLIMVMTAISQLNYSILTKRYQALGNERDELCRLKQISKNCMIYAGMVQYKMPRETYSLLISLESLI